MDDTPDKPPHGIKLLPRNLTARAAYLVAGNPISSRPESGVENSHPGLEFDPRNIDRTFFPGLAFDFPYRVGARLTQLYPAELPAGIDLAEQDLAASPLFLWGLYGRFGANPGQSVRFDAWGQDGYLVLRQIRDLEHQSALTVVVGPACPDESDAQAHARWQQTYAQAMAGASSLVASQVQRDAGQIAWAALIGQRARYLDDEGVIDPQVEALAPGFLTQSLCSPWQWDFADCGCYYWAASRPDIVTDQGDTPGALPRAMNYQRDASQPPSAPPTMPSSTAPTPASTASATPGVQGRSWVGWMRGTISLPQMIDRWHTLPVVADDRERHSGAVPPAPIWPQPSQPCWDVDQIVAQLSHLATVEHALAVQYLYAFYSLNASPAPGSPSGQALSPAMQQDLATCAREIRGIAIDEMRHLQWANEALALFGQPPSLGRASQWGLAPYGGALTHVPSQFELAPLTDATLKRFTEIEQPSRVNSPGGTPSGLYVHILLSLRALPVAQVPGGEPGRRRLMQLIKLLIDEGDEHAQRFRLIQARLPADLSLRLKVSTGPREAPAGSQAAEWLAQGDEHYAALLASLAQIYGAGSAEPALPGSSLAPMGRLGAVARQLADLGYGLRFRLPQAAVAHAPPEAAA